MFVYDIHVRVHVIFRASTSVKYGSGDFCESGQYTIKLLQKTAEYVETVTSAKFGRKPTGLTSDLHY